MSREWIQYLTFLEIFLVGISLRRQTSDILAIDILQASSREGGIYLLHHHSSFLVPPASKSFGWLQEDRWELVLLQANYIGIYWAGRRRIFFDERPQQYARVLIRATNQRFLQAVIEPKMSVWWLRFVKVTFLSKSVGQFWEKWMSLNRW